MTNKNMHQSIAATPAEAAVAATAWERRGISAVSCVADDGHARV